MDQDCFMMVDPRPEIPESERAMMVLCIPCREESYPDSGWFYRGTVDGYGPFDFICDVCGKVIHKHEEEPEDDVMLEISSLCEGISNLNQPEEYED